ENSAKGLPTIQGNIILNCNQTGETIATFDGTYLTAVRTGAIGGNAVRHLAKQNVKTLAVIGTGVQGFYQTLAACEERNFEQIHVYNRTKGEKVSKFIKNLKVHYIRISKSLKNKHQKKPLRMPMLLLQQQIRTTPFYLMIHHY